MEKTVLEASKVERLASAYKSADAREIVEFAVDRFPNLALACSFGAEDMVLLDILMKVNPDALVFYLDTDVLFPETYELRDRAVAKYGLTRLVRVSPALTLEEQADQYGEKLWARDPNLCCHLRKVRPLRNILSPLDAWVTGIRRVQSPTRAKAEVFEVDANFGLIKINPLAYWSDERVWAYIHDHDVPFNLLHEQGYPSIGCVHCTRPIAPGDDPRSGRWAGFTKTECGLHWRGRETS